MIDNRGKYKSTAEPLQKGPSSKPNKQENEQNDFYAFFQEMNEKAHEAFSRCQPEPERALEFLKQAEEFMKKIEKSRKSFKAQQERS